MKTRLTKDERREIVMQLVRYLLEQENGFRSTTWGLLQDCGYDVESPDDLVSIHDALLKEAEKAGLELDMSAHTGLLEGMPYHLDFVMYRGNTGVKCPRCGSKRAARILYGMPAFSEKLRKELDDGVVALGGCIIYSVEVAGEQVEVGPTRVCQKCGKEFGRNPLLITMDKQTAEDYRTIVEEICFTVGKGKQESRVTICKTENGALLRTEEDAGKKTAEKQLTAAEWEKLVDKLFRKLFLHEWSKHYDKPYPLEGAEWKLSLKLTGGRVRNWCGSNPFMPYWEELTRLFAFAFR